jgi:hypothetical protein
MHEEISYYWSKTIRPVRYIMRHQDRQDQTLHAHSIAILNVDYMEVLP